MIKEVCVTVSYITTILGHHAASLGADILPLLLPLLANSTKVIASAGDVCIKFIIKVKPVKSPMFSISSL